MYFCRHIAKKKKIYKKIQSVMYFTEPSHQHAIHKWVPTPDKKSLNRYLTAFPFFTPQSANPHLGPVIYHPFGRFAHYMHWMYRMHRQRKRFAHPQQAGHSHHVPNRLPDQIREQWRMMLLRGVKDWSAKLHPNVCLTTAATKYSLPANTSSKLLKLLVQPSDKVYGF